MESTGKEMIESQRGKSDKEEILSACYLRCTFLLPIMCLVQPHSQGLSPSLSLEQEREEGKKRYPGNKFGVWCSIPRLCIICWSSLLFLCSVLKSLYLMYERSTLQRSCSNALVGK